MQTFIASVLVILKVDNHYVISRVSDDARLYGWLSVNYMMIVMPLGMLLAKKLLSSRTSMTSRLSHYTNAPIDLNFIGSKSLKYSVWFFTFVSTLSCLYVFYVIGYFPFFKIFDVTSLLASELRITASRGFSGNIYIRNFFALTMMPILSYMWCFYFIRTKNVLDFFVFCFSFVFSVSILYYDFSKAPMLSYLLSFVFVYFYSLGKINKLLSALAIAVVFLLLVAMYQFMGVSLAGFINYNSGPVGRIILGQAAGLYMMFDIFPADHAFIGLSSLSQALSNIFGVEYIERAARITMQAFNPAGVAAGTAGVMNSLYVAEAWANFGLLGVLLSPLWVGFVIQTLYIFFLKSPKSPFHLAFFVAFSTGGGITGGFNEYLYNPNLILISFFALCVFSLAIAIKRVK